MINKKNNFFFFIVEDLVDKQKKGQLSFCWFKFLQLDYLVCINFIGLR